VLDACVARSSNSIRATSISLSARAATCSKDAPSRAFPAALVKAPMSVARAAPAANAKTSRNPVGPPRGAGVAAGGCASDCDLGSGAGAVRAEIKLSIFK